MLCIFSDVSSPNCNGEETCKKRQREDIIRETIFCMCCFVRVRVGRQRVIVMVRQHAPPWGYASHDAREAGECFSECLCGGFVPVCKLKQQHLFFCINWSALPLLINDMGPCGCSRMPAGADQRFVTATRRCLSLLRLLPVQHDDLNGRKLC